MLFGRVLDPQWAAVVGTTVTVRNVETGVASTFRTNDTGYYEANLLIPGTYEISAEMQGFKKLVRQGIVLLRTPFPGNIIPKSRMINPAYELFNKIYPLPNVQLPTGADPVNNYLASQTPYNWDCYAYSNRVDFQFYHGSKLDDLKKVDRTWDKWFNTDNFERVASKGPAAYHVRVFPTRIDGLRADSTNQWNANAAKNFRLTEGASLQLRLDVLNVQNRSRMAAPVTNPYNTNFGRIVSQTSATNRWLQVQARIWF